MASSEPFDMQRWPATHSADDSQAKSGSVLKAVTLDAKDVGHLHGRPSHLSFFR